MDEIRKPMILLIGVPLSFFAPADLRVARSLNFSTNSEHTLEKLSILASKKDKLMVEMLPFCGFFWSRIVYTIIGSISIYYKYLNINLASFSVHFLPTIF